MPPHRDRTSWAIVLCAGLIQIVLGTVLSWTNLPLSDEGFYGVPAQVFSVSGTLRNPVLESAGVEYLKGIDQAAYWMAPLGMMLQGAAFKLFGFGLLVQRGLSTFCGFGTVLFCFLAFRRLMAVRVAALAALLLSVDFVFLTLSSRGRADIISLFFAMAAIAAYMHWRERSLTFALAVAHIACALSGMVHPNGGIAAVTSLVVVTYCLDRARLRWRHLAVVAACYSVVGAGWGLFIAQAPGLFVAQFLGNAANRFAVPMTLTGLIKGEIARNISAYGLENAHGLRLLRYLLPLSYFGAVLHCTFSKDLRRRSGVLLLMFAGVLLGLVLFEGTKQGWYLVHLRPLLAALLATSASSLWKSGKTLSRMVTAAQAGVIALGVASLLYSASNRNLQQLYQPAIAFLNATLVPGDLLFARSEFYFGLACRSCLRDDQYLGYFSGRHASYIVVDPDYEGQWAKLRMANPEAYRAIEASLLEYSEVFRNGTYRVLRKNATGLSGPR